MLSKVWLPEEQALMLRLRPTPRVRIRRANLSIRKTMITTITREKRRMRTRVGSRLSRERRRRKTSTRLSNSQKIKPAFFL